ncbi:MAG: hypothetical protein ABI972_24245 [Acidobacteriota bacterium]
MSKSEVVASTSYIATYDEQSREIDLGVLDGQAFHDSPANFSCRMNMTSAVCVTGLLRIDSSPFEDVLNGAKER